MKTVFNNQYYLDLTNQVFYHRKNEKSPKLAILDYEESFDSYQLHHIKEDYRARNKEVYWQGIQDAANAYFKKGI